MRIDEGEIEDLKRDAIRDRMPERDCAGCGEAFGAYDLDVDGYCRECAE